MNDYARVARKLHTVRRAWKRAAALGGFAVIFLDAVGLFTIALLLDLLYRPRLPMRVGIFAVAAAGILYLLARHVVAPLLRRIGDQRLALFVEEHDARFEGALIAAAEFRSAEHLAGRQAQLVDEIIAAAAARAQRIDLRKVIDLSRLKKYGVAALVVVLFYGGVGLLFPGTAGRHAARVLTPWHPTSEDRPEARPAPVELPPIQLTLSRHDESILRGTPFELEATLSRPSYQPVLLHFRAATGDSQTRWRHLAMKEAQKLNTFHVLLPDVNEDTHFFVATADAKSATHLISVYDPIVVEGVEVVTRFPQYLRLPERAEMQVVGDVAAPVGSTVTVSIITNRPLAGGELAWTGAAAQPLAVDPNQATVASASFPVEKDASYTYTVRDVEGQVAQGPDTATVRALPDEPPSIEITHPAEAVDLHPLGEITIQANAVDDFGIDSVRLIYMRPARGSQRHDGPSVSLEAGPLRRNAPAIARAALAFRLEDLLPRPTPEESIACYLECRDRKGQIARSDVLLLTVAHYETWATWEPGVPEPMEVSDVKSLEPYFKATWHLHNLKPTLPPNDFARQCGELADSMTDPDTHQLYTFAATKEPAKQKHVDKAAQFVRTGHDALRAHDTAKAIDAFLVALAEIARLDLFAELPVIITGAPPPDGAEQQLNQLALIEAQRVEAEAAAANADAPPSQPQLDQAKQAEDIAQKARDLERKQAEIVREAKELAGAGEKPDAGGKRPDADKLAGKQDGVADETRNTGQQAKDDPAAGTDPDLADMARRLSRAAADMKQAARKMRAGKLDEATVEAEKARRALRDVGERASKVSQAKLERTLDDAEARLERLIDQQRKVRAKAEALDKKVPQGKQPTPDDKRECRKAAAAQVRVKSGLRDVERDVDTLRKWAEDAARPDTAKRIDEARRALARGRPGQKMANAVVELAGHRAKAAAAEQKKAENTLEKVLEGVRGANESLASDRESELRRARNEARRIEKDVQALKPQERPTPAQTRQRADGAEKVAYDIRRFAKHLAKRDFADRRDTEHLAKEAAAPAELARGLSRHEPKRQQIFKVVARVRNRLEAEYDAKLQAKKLFTAQREPCPPQYRHLVNKYYEALSKAGR